MERLLTTQEVADLLQVPVTTIYQWRHQGKGPKGYVVGRHIRFRPEDVDSWLDEQKRQQR